MKVVRLNINAPRTARTAFIRAIPIVVNSPYYDLSFVEQVAVCDALTIGLQVGIVMYGLSSNDKS
jgi:hypothetical protein